MGPNTWWCTLLLLIIPLASSSISHAAARSQPYDLHSLRALIQSSASDALARNPRSGVVLNLTLPANLSGVSASVVRFHSGSFVARGGADPSSSFLLPPGLFPVPHVTRLALLFEDLAALSTSYFAVPGHVLAAPVLGLSAYNASPAGLGSPVTLLPVIRPITALFPNNGPIPNNVTKKCVTFGFDGSVGMVNMTDPGRCTVSVPGYFTVAVEARPPGVSSWWVVGLVAGMGGLAAAMLVGYRVWRRRKMEEMERESEKEVCFDTFWVGGSKMPSAPMVRTQPVLENEYTP